MLPRNDLAKCPGTGCAFREGCDRFMRPAGDRQVWCDFHKTQDDDCVYFIPVERA